MPSSYDKLIEEIIAGSKKANEANEKRYTELLTHLESLTGQVTGAGGTYGQAQALLENVGNEARLRIAETSGKSSAQIEQDLISRGLGNSTMRANLQRAVTSDTNRALSAQAESEAAQKAGLLTQRAGAEISLGGMRAGAIEGRTDAGPDLGMFASLLQAAAANEKSQAKLVDSTWGGRQNQPIMGGGGGGGGGGLSPSSGGGGGGGGGYVPGKTIHGSSGQGTGTVTATASPDMSLADLFKGSTVFTPQGQVTSGVPREHPPGTPPASEQGGTIESVPEPTVGGGGGGQDKSYAAYSKWISAKSSYDRKLAPSYKDWGGTDPSKGGVAPR